MPNYKISPTEANRELARRELARRHFKDCSKYIYDGYMENWHIDLICDALERVWKGEIRFLIIEAPPRHSKSLNVSKLFPAFVMGKNLDDDVIVSSYSGDLAVDHGRDTRNIVDSRAYQNLFDTRLAADSKAKGKWNTQGKGAYNAVGVGGSATGRGAKYFIVDDPFKDRKEADSQLIRDDRYKWLRAVARTRLTPDGAMVIMHTRWHEDDIIGRLTEEDDWVDYFDFLKGVKAKWVRLTLKGIAEYDEVYRKKGEALWPERYNLDELNDIRRSIGPYEWSALYQANPVDDESREFKQEWFQYRKLSEVEDMVTRKFATIDTALSSKEGSDYTGVVRNYVNLKDEWHFKATRYRIDAKGIIDLIFMLHDEGMEKIGIEDGAFTLVVKPFLEDEMKKRGKMPHVVPLKHRQIMKETRIRALIPFYANKRIFHIDDTCDDLEHEAAAFPKGTHDDVIDAAAYQTQIADKPGKTKELVQKPYESPVPYDQQTLTPNAEPIKDMRPPSEWGIKKQKYQQPGYEPPSPFGATM